MFAQMIIYVTFRKIKESERASAHADALSYLQCWYLILIDSVYFALMKSTSVTTIPVPEIIIAAISAASVSLVTISAVRMMST